MQTVKIIFFNCEGSKQQLNNFVQDPTNLNGKVQKHQNFEQELNANKSRMEEITSTGQELIETNHYASGIYLLL